MSDLFDQAKEKRKETENQIDDKRRDWVRLQSTCGC